MTENQEKSGVSSFGERLQRYRKRSKLTGEALAKKMNAEYGSGTATRSLIADIENDRRKNIDLDLIIQLAHCIQMSPLALVCDLEQPFMVSDNPVFQGRTNASVARIFLVNFSQPVAEGVMQKTSKIMYQTNVYSEDILMLRVDLKLYRDFIDGKYKVDDLIQQFPMGPLSLEDSCRSDIEKIRKQQDYLRTLGIIIPDSERDNLQEYEKTLRQYSQEVRDKKIVNQVDIDKYRELNAQLTQNYGEKSPESF